MKNTRDRASGIKVLILTVPLAPSPEDTAHLSRGQMLRVLGLDHLQGPFARP